MKKIFFVILIFIFITACVKTQLPSPAQQTDQGNAIGIESQDNIIQDFNDQEIDQQMNSLEQDLNNW